MIYYILNKYSGSYSVKLEKEIVFTSKKLMPGIETKVLYTVLYSKFNNFNQYLPDIDANILKQNDIIVAVGGDGTINDCLNFIHINILNDIVKLAVIPKGTGNNMLKTLNLSKRISSSIRIIRDSKIEKLQYGLINGKYPFFNCSIGFTSFILRNRVFRSRNAYVFDILLNLFKYNSSKVKLVAKSNNPLLAKDLLEKKIFSGFFINTKYYASIIPFLRKNSKNGKMRFIYISESSFFSIMKFIYILLTSQFEKLDVHEASDFLLTTSREVEIEIDGDIIPYYKEYKISYNRLINVIKNYVRN